MAIDACVSQYANVCSFRVSVLKLSASSCTNPVVPTRSTRVKWSAANAAQVKRKRNPVRKASPLTTMLSPSPPPHVRPTRRPYFGVRRPEQRQHGRAYRCRQMRDPRIVPDVQPRLRQPAGKFIEIVDAHRAVQRRVVLPGAPPHGHHTLQLFRQRAKLFERPVLARAAGERMDRRVVLALHRTLDARDAVAAASGEAAQLTKVKVRRVDPDRKSKRLNS